MTSDKLRISVLDLSRIDLATKEEIRQQCLAREDYNRTMKGIENNFAAKRREIATLRANLADANQQISEKDQQISEKDAHIASLQAQLAEINTHKI